MAAYALPTEAELDDEEIDEDKGESSVGTHDEDLLEEIRTNFKDDLQYWSDIRAEAATDMRYLAGDSWDPNERSSRTGGNSQGAPDNAVRLCLNFDELNQNVNQVVNNFLLNTPVVSIDPKGDGANDKTARDRGDTIRQIEYRSNGKSAYGTAFKCAVQRSYGFVRIIRDYESPRTFRQQLSLEAVPNPDSILPDPAGVRVDGSDWDRCFVLKNYRHSQFRMEWPDAEVKSFGEDLIRSTPEWLTDKSVQVAEYWKAKKKRRTLIAIDRPILLDLGRTPDIGQVRPVTEFILDDNPNAEVIKKKLYIDGKFVAAVTAQRQTIIRTICQYLTNGIEILEQNEQSEDCPWIPIIPFYGEEMYVPVAAGPKRSFLSLIRLARDAQTAYSYVRTTQMEVIGQIPKTPYLGYAGQFAGYEQQWEKVNRVRLSHLQANATTEATGDAILPLPQQTHYEPAVEAMEVTAEALRRAIQSAMGVSPLPTAALRRNEKSGVALKQIESTQQIGSYHFMDNAKQSVAHGGRIMDALLRSTYDTPRELGMRQANNEFKSGNTVQPIDQGSGEQVNIFEHGEHEVTVSTGPSYDSQRQQVESFVDQLVSAPGLIEAAIANPGSAAGKLLGLSIKLRNLGPLGDEMVDVVDPEAAEDGSPESLARQNQQMKQQLQLAQKAIQELRQAASKEQTTIESENIKARAALMRDRFNNKAKKEIEAAKDRTTILGHLIDKGAESNLTLLETQVAKLQRDLELSHEKIMQAADHAHEAGMQHSQQDAASAGQDQAHQQTLEQQQNAADLAPAPEPTAQ